MIRGDRIGLRPLTTDDAWLLYGWFNDQRVLEGLGLRKAMFSLSLEEQRAIVEGKLTSPTDRDFIIVDIARERAIGWAGLTGIDLRNGAAEMNVVVGVTDELDKAATEAASLLVAHAFEVMNLHRVSVCVPTYNRSAIDSYAAAGLTVEGTMREDHYHHGGYGSSHIMSVLRDEGGRR
jgi:RimJ/RimL family protein N-acetyltransferase